MTLVMRAALAAFAALAISAVPVEPARAQGAPPRDRIQQRQGEPPPLQRRRVEDRRAQLPMCSPRSMNLDAPGGGRCFQWGNPKRLERQIGPGAPCFLTVNQCTGYMLGNRRIYP